MTTLSQSVRPIFFWAEAKGDYDETESSILIADYDILYQGKAGETIAKRDSTIFPDE